ncbi:MAG TPA: metal-dependent hydrolase [Acidimicrobiales bacterium]
MTTTAYAPSPARKVPTRRISFDELLADVPRHFAAEGDLIASHLIAALSALFPDGEDFFVRSVRAVRNQVTDPELKRQVAGFIGQEAMHGREHRALNDRLAELGYPTKRIERFTKRGLAMRWRLMSVMSNLAATAALEHFTATLAEALLTDEGMREMCGHPGVRDLLLWHALEESEHKAVAFDVYRHVGGSERLRVFTMNLITVMFLTTLTVQVVLSLLADRETYRRGALLASWRRVRKTPIVSREMWRRLRAYNRPGFHPDERDTTELVERWRAELFGPDGRLAGLVA